MKVAIASDHGGFSLKEELRTSLTDWGIQVLDKGCHSPESVDYVDYAAQAVEAVLGGECERAILICGTGIGMSIAANKFPGIRAALCHDHFSAQATREHNDSNVLCLGARVIGSSLAESIVKVWLNTEFSGGRHQRRIDKISAIERRFCKQ
ncbi:MAG TPA: ribose 5-phosphate isomerase B [Firmicutes bacterium]|nr:ribose 5-phosphate isomerase B [Bacillota bacterium]